MGQEVTWDWPQIAAMLAWRLRHRFGPRGIILTRRDLGSLPADRVLFYERTDVHIRFDWVTEIEAHRRSKFVGLHARSSDELTGVQRLEGRYHKTAVVLLWKYFRDGCTLVQKDLTDLPADEVLLIHGHANDLDMRFVSRAEAARIQKDARDNEGRIITEAIK
jgi:hypothetical protein